MAKQPLYEQIEHQLRQRIDSLSDGDRVSSEHQLADEFGVARMTARAALSALERDGLLERIPGRGSFVRKSLTSRRIAQLVSFHDQALAAGKTPTSVVVSAERRASTATESHALGNPESVISITRIRCFDDVPVAIERAVFVPALAALLELNLETDSLHAAMRALGCVPTGGHSTLGARRADEDALGLRVTPDTALLVETRTIHDISGLPLEYTSSAYVPQRYSLNVDFTIGAHAD